MDGGVQVWRSVNEEHFILLAVDQVIVQTGKEESLGDRPTRASATMPSSAVDSLGALFENPRNVKLYRELIHATAHGMPDTGHTDTRKVTKAADPNVSAKKDLHSGVWMWSKGIFLRRMRDTVVAVLPRSILILGIGVLLTIVIIQLRIDGFTKNSLEGDAAAITLNTDVDVNNPVALNKGWLVLPAFIILVGVGGIVRLVLMPCCRPLYNRTDTYMLWCFMVRKDNQVALSLAWCCKQKEEEPDEAAIIQV